jgi:hypothetical protein
MLDSESMSSESVDVKCPSLEVLVVGKPLCISIDVKTGTFVLEEGRLDQILVFRMHSMFETYRLSRESTYFEMLLVGTLVAGRHSCILIAV